MQSNIKNLRELLNFVKFPYFTEKAINLQTDGQYTFIVDRKITKPEVKYLFETLFEINIVKVTTLTIPTKIKKVGRSIGKKPRYKKVVIKLRQGETIKDLGNY
jgi:large subunit ribosomal protein L23